MKRSARFVLTVVLCLALGVPGVVPRVSAIGPADTGTWMELSLHGDSLECLVINPRTPSTLYAAVSGSGVFHSTDSGASWTAMNKGLPDMFVGCLVIDPLAPSTLYAGALDGGVFRSSDSGVSWTAMNKGLTDTLVTCLVIDPLTPSTLYVGTMGHEVFRSTDSGATWTTASKGLIGLDVASLAIDPLAPCTLYAALSYGGVFHSTDSGATWRAMNKGLTTDVLGLVTSVTCLAINPLTPSILFAGTKDGSVFRYHAASPYTLAAVSSPSSGGTITKSPNRSSYALATSVVVTASPASGYTFIGWSGALSGTKNPATITMDADKAVTASFTRSTKRVLQLKIGSTAMLVDGGSVALEAAPLILNSRTLLPIRAIIEGLGGTVAWDPIAHKVAVTLGTKTVVLWIGKSLATVNGVSTPIDATDASVVPEIINSRTMLPLRFVSENLGCTVVWAAATQTITITYTP